MQSSKQLTKNPVQKDFLNRILDIEKTETDDIYHTANLIAALKKAEQAIIRDWHINFEQSHGMLEPYINAAMSDWAHDPGSDDKEAPEADEEEETSNRKNAVQGLLQDIRNQLGDYQAETNEEFIEIAKGLAGLAKEALNEVK